MADIFNILDTPQGGAAEDYILIEDQKAAGADGGGFTSGSYQTRDLNVEVEDTGNNAVVAANQVTLLAGTYRFRGEAMGFGVDAHQLRLQDITGTATLKVGITVAASAASAVQTSATIAGRFTITVDSIIELQHRAATTQAGNGLGNANGTFPDVSIFSRLEFWKEN